MDIPRSRPKLTWRDTSWWRATRQSVISSGLMVMFAAPAALYLARRLTSFVHEPLDIRLLALEFAKGTLAMMPYLWAYFYALERIAVQRRKDDDLYRH